MYIGCIGIRGGKSGLGQRYQWQYVKTSMAIFGKDKSSGQVSFSATFTKPKMVTDKVIGAAESIVQHSFIKAKGEQEALFKPVKLKAGFNLLNKGAKNSMPRFVYCDKNGVKMLTKLCSPRVYAVILFRFRFILPQTRHCKYCY